MRLKGGRFFQFSNIPLHFPSVLREIDFRDFTSLKPTISTPLEGLNIAFCEFLHFLKAEI